MEKEEKGRDCVSKCIKIDELMSNFRMSTVKFSPSDGSASYARVSELIPLFNVGLAVSIPVITVRSCNQIEPENEMTQRRQR